MRKLLLGLCAGWACCAGAASMLVECESFDALGGWVVDPHSTKVMGSTYIMAHGYGKPVEKAIKGIQVPEAGNYTVWARTRDWTAVWGRGTPAGRFKISVTGNVLPVELGTNGKDWAWQKAGTLKLPKGQAWIGLRDLTGFNARCDAIYFSTDPNDAPPNEAKKLDAWRRGKSGILLKDYRKKFDLIVVGGGVPGICAAMSASRFGMNVLLLQDRGVLGGCNSSEVRVGLGGHIHVGQYPKLGNIVEEIQPLHGSGATYPAEYYEDARKEILFRNCRSKCALMLNEHVYALEKDPQNPKKIKAVISRGTRTGAETRFEAPLFVDATGDAVLARMMNCEVMYGREPRSRFGEINAPFVGDRQVMGHSVLWYAARAGQEMPFPDIDWALPFTEDSVYYIRNGDWEQEAGQYRDMADETEIIRDYGLLSIFSNWNYVKNHSKRKKEFARDYLSWVSPIGGKRESYRTVGDVILTQNDLEKHIPYPDATALITWDIDQHFPDPKNEKAFPEPFRSCAYHRGFGSPYPVPYRCLYARDCDNLFLAGRHISCSHVAFAAVRVMRTLGMLGEVVGMASKICKEHQTTPRGVYIDHLDQLKKMMKAGVPKLPLYHAYGSGINEKYHFKELGFTGIYPPQKKEINYRLKRAIKDLGMIHRNEHPELMTTNAVTVCGDSEMAKKKSFQLVLADESRGRIHLFDPVDPTKSFWIPVPKPLWDLQRVGDGHYRSVCHGGFTVTDLKQRKIVDRFISPQLAGVTSVCDLPTGGFLASANPKDVKAVDILEFSPDRKLVRKIRFDGIFNSRGVLRPQAGELFITHDNGFIRGRLPEKGEKGIILERIPQTVGRNMFQVVQDPKDGSYWAGTGYGAQLLHFSNQAKFLTAWQAEPEGEKSGIFFAQPYPLPNGHVLVCNWTGHGEDDSVKGWQVLEFDAKGKVVWKLFYPELFGSVSGIDVISPL